MIIRLTYQNILVIISDTYQVDCRGLLVIISDTCTYHVECLGDNK